MAQTDLQLHSRSVAAILHRLVHGIAQPRRTNAAQAALADENVSLRLDPGILHDIGASPAYRDYASRLTLGAGSQGRQHDLGYLARWGAVR